MDRRYFPEMLRRVSTAGRATSTGAATSCLLDTKQKANRGHRQLGASQSWEGVPASLLVNAGARRQRLQHSVNQSPVGGRTCELESSEREMSAQPLHASSKQPVIRYSSRIREDQPASRKRPERSGLPPFQSRRPLEEWMSSLCRFPKAAFLSCRRNCSKRFRFMCPLWIPVTTSLVFGTSQSLRSKQVCRRANGWRSNSGIQLSRRSTASWLQAWPTRDAQRTRRTG